MMHFDELTLHNNKFNGITKQIFHKFLGHHICVHMPVALNQIWKRISNSQQFFCYDKELKG